ncbi:hypothetical protein BIV24_21870 [Streptomyces colonosanans]|uniref:Uncharacterized protein n=1 Tax=Streptomyces colonosanans TaxID=1428652 RepID=A0A1S2P3K6_9ACTN|nr:hypothetical protein BIV24_21870 [Streptomyces colonosanans]
MAILRSEPAVFGPVASDPTGSRSMDTLAASGEKALDAIRRARSEIRSRVWSLADGRAPDGGGEVTAGHRPARHRPQNAKRSADSVGRPSCKIEASLTLSSVGLSEP